MLRRTDEAVSDPGQAKVLDVVSPKSQLRRAAGTPENVQVERLHEFGIDVAKVLGRGEEERLDWLQRAAASQEVDPSGPAAWVRLPREEAQIQLIDNPAQCLG